MLYTQRVTATYAMKPPVATSAFQAWAASATPHKFEVNNAVNPDQLDLWIYDIIGWGVEAMDVVEAIRDSQASLIVVHVNSPGGDVFDGVAIYNVLKAHPAKVEVRIEGLAASAASFLAMAGDEVKIGRNAQIMIHRAWTFMIGNSEDALKTAAELEKIDGTIADTYMRRAGGTVDEWLAAMVAETWYTGPEAIAAGLADGFLASDESAPTPAPESEDDGEGDDPEEPEAPESPDPMDSWGAQLAHYLRNSVTATAGTTSEAPADEGDTTWQGNRVAVFASIGGQS